MSDTKERPVVLAKIARKVKRYDDMLDAMNEVVQAGEPLTQQERSLLYIAFHSVVDERLTSWRTISRIARDPSVLKVKKMVARKYKDEVERELRDICSNAQNTLDKQLVTGVYDLKGAELHVFLLNMKSELYRKLAEISTGRDKDKFMNLADEQFELAEQTIEKWMPPTHPHRLRFCVIYSVFMYDILDRRAEARFLAKRTLEEAIAIPEHAHKDRYDEIQFILQLLTGSFERWERDER